MSVNRARLAVWGLAAAALFLTGCSAPASNPQPANSATAAASSEPNVEACTYLAGGAIDDSIDFFQTYTTDRD